MPLVLVILYAVCITEEVWTWR